MAIVQVLTSGGGQFSTNSMKNYCIWHRMCARSPFSSTTIQPRFERFNISLKFATRKQYGNGYKDRWISQNLLATKYDGKGVDHDPEQKQNNIQRQLIMCVRVYTYLEIDGDAHSVPTPIEPRLPTSLGKRVSLIDMSFANCHSFSKTDECK